MHILKKTNNCYAVRRKRPKKKLLTFWTQQNKTIDLSDLFVLWHLKKNLWLFTTHSTHYIEMFFFNIYKNILKQAHKLSTTQCLEMISLFFPPSLSTARASARKTTTEHRKCSVSESLWCVITKGARKFPAAFCDFFFPILSSSIWFLAIKSWIMFFFPNDQQSKQYNEQHHNDAFLVSQQKR